VPDEFKNWRNPGGFPRNIEAVYREMTVPLQEKERPM